MRDQRIGIGLILPAAKFGPKHWPNQTSHRQCVDNSHKNRTEQEMILIYDFFLCPRGHRLGIGLFRVGFQPWPFSSKL